MSHNKSSSLQSAKRQIIVASAVFFVLFIIGFAVYVGVSKQDDVSISDDQQMHEQRSSIDNLREPKLLESLHNKQHAEASSGNKNGGYEEQLVPVDGSLRIAVAALLTSNSKRGEHLHRAIDGLAVLRRSMLEQLPLKIQKQFTFVALITDSVDEKWARVLREKMHWQVRRYNKPPVDAATEIKNKIIAKEIVTDGAIGIDELTKLDVFNWGDEFDIVMLLDADIMFHHPFPELYQKLSGKALRWTKGGWVNERINGGFLIIEPSGETGKKHFKNIMEIVKEGDFRSGTGWRGSGIGWTYGGRTVQGVLPYYFLHYYPRHVSRHNATDDLQLNRCKYNNMDQLPECKVLPMDQVTSNHFTGDCMKPWWCGVTKRSARCGTWVRKWKQVYARELRAQNVLIGTAAQLEQQPLSSCDFRSLARHWYQTL